MLAKLAVIVVALLFVYGLIIEPFVIPLLTNFQNMLVF